MFAAAPEWEPAGLEYVLKLAQSIEKNIIYVELILTLPQVSPAFLQNSPKKVGNFVDDGKQRERRIGRLRRFDGKKI